MVEAVPVVTLSINRFRVIGVTVIVVPTSETRGRTEVTKDLCPSLNCVSPVVSVAAIAEPVTIDGTTQAGYTNTPRIELNGAGAGDQVSGLYLLTSNSLIRGLAINRFSREGIRIEVFGNNVIQANFIGTGVRGTNSPNSRLPSAVLARVRRRSVVPGRKSSAKNTTALRYSPNGALRS